MKNKHLQYLLFLLLFTIVMDFGIGHLYESLYYSEKSKNNDRLIHSVLGTNEDILIFGSSRALHHYNPQIIEDSLKMSCYNVGAGGQNIYFHLALLQSTLERYTPKIAILELMSIDFIQTPPQWDTEKLSTLMPFAEKSEAIYRTVMLRGASEKFKLLSDIYPYNSLLYSMLRNIFWPFDNNLKGFIPIHRNWTKPIVKSQLESEYTEDKNKIHALYQFVETCQKKHIQLKIFISPNYVLNDKENIYAGVSKNLLDKYSLLVLNFGQDSLFLEHPEYFADPLHLNENGANIYTGKVSHIVKTELQTDINY